MRTLRSLRHRNFRILFSANLISNIGGWAQIAAEGWLILELTGSGTYLGLIIGIRFLPTLFFGMSGGKIADRFNKRKVLMITNIVMALSAFSVGTLALLGTIHIWQVAFFAFTLGLANAVDGPTFQSFIGEMVGREDLPNAVGLNSANVNGARLIGPGLSGLLIATYGTGYSFIFNGFSYLFVVIALLFVRESELFLDVTERSSTKIRQAIAYVRVRPDLLSVLITIFFVATFGLNFNIFNAMMATDVFAADAAAFGALGSVLAIGTLSGALITARLAKRREPSFVMKSAMVFSGMLMLASQAPNYFSYAILLPAAGCFAIITNISANTLMQVRTDTEIRGRVMGIYLTAFLGGTPLLSPFIGLLTQHIGPRNTMLLCGAIAFIATFCTSIVFRGKGKAPISFAVEDVLQTAYDDKKN